MNEKEKYWDLITCICIIFSQYIEVHIIYSSEHMEVHLSVSVDFAVFNLLSLLVYMCVIVCERIARSYLLV